MDAEAPVPLLTCSRCKEPFAPRPAGKGGRPQIYCGRPCKVVASNAKRAAKIKTSASGAPRLESLPRERERGSPLTCVMDYTDDEHQLLQAMERYKKQNHRKFPSYSEVLAVLVSLGWRKVAEPEPLPVIKDAA